MANVLAQLAGGMSDQDYANALIRARQQSVPEAFRTAQEPGLEAPMVSPDDLIGSGAATKLALLAKLGIAKAGLPALLGMAGKKLSSADLEAMQLAIPKTQFEIAHEVAQKNAALPIEQGGLGLPPDNTAMDRARAMGFDTPAYSGRYADYAVPNRTLYTTPDAEYASKYTNPSASSMGGKQVDYENLSPNVMPLLQRSADILDTRTKQGLKVFNEEFYNQYGNATPLMKSGLPDWVEGEDFGQMFLDRGMPYKGVVLDEGAAPSLVGDIVHRGYSSAIHDPSAIRSRFAAFDPMQRNSANILAGGLGGAVGLNALYNMAQEPYQ